MVTYVIFSAIVDEVSMGVVQVQIVARLLVDRVTLGDPDVAAILPEETQQLGGSNPKRHIFRCTSIS